MSIKLFTAFFLGIMASCLPNRSTAQISNEQQRKLFDYYFYQALNARSVEDYDAQYDLLEYCYQLDSTNANLLYELGEWHQAENGNSLQAIDYYRRAASLQPQNYYYGRSYGITCMQEGLLEEAIAEFRHLSQLFPNKAEAWYYLAEVCRMNGDIENAIDALNNVESIIGINDQLSIQKYQLYNIAGKKKEAFDEMLRYIEKYPREVKYMALLARLYTYDQQYDQAEKIFEQAKLIDPSDPLLITYLAEYYEKTNNHSQAEKVMTDALFQPKIDLETKINLVRQYIGALRQENLSVNSAAPILDSLLLAYPQEANFNLIRGDLYMFDNKREDARFQYQIFAEAYPENPAGWEKMLQTAFPDQVKTCIEICQRALVFQPKNPVFFFYLGVGYYIFDAYLSALETLQEGVNYVQESNKDLKSEYYSYIGDLFHQLGNNDSAFISYENSLRNNPQNLHVLNNYAYYLAIQNRDLVKAENMSSITIKAEPSNSTYLDTYGWILFLQRAFPLAKIYLEKAVNYGEERGTASAPIYEHYGDVLFLTGEEEKAIEYWEKAKESGNSDSPTLEKKIRTGKYIP